MTTTTEDFMHHLDSNLLDNQEVLAHTDCYDVTDITQNGDRTGSRANP